MIYHKIQITIKQDRYTKANESGEEAQKETMRLIDIGLPQSKNKVNSNSKTQIKLTVTVRHKHWMDQTLETFVAEDLHRYQKN